MTSVSAKHFTPAELAEAWGLSPETIRKLFRNEPGVLKIGRAQSRFRQSNAILTSITFQHVTDGGNLVRHWLGSQS